MLSFFRLHEQTVAESIAEPHPLRSLCDEDSLQWLLEALDGSSHSRLTSSSSLPAETLICIRRTLREYLQTREVSALQVLDSLLQTSQRETVAATTLQLLPSLPLRLLKGCKEDKATWRLLRQLGELRMTAMLE